jgi:2-methylaconitate cis-trans-isomerase PrpF
MSAGHIARALEPGGAGGQQVGLKHPGGGIEVGIKATQLGGETGPYPV